MNETISAGSEPLESSASSTDDDKIADHLPFFSLSIDKASSILREQFPLIKGFFSLIGTGKLVFPSQLDRSYKTIQIHYKGRGNWLVTSCEAYGTDVYIYDCNLKTKKKGRPIIWNKTKIQIAKLFGFENEVLIKVPRFMEHPDIKNSALYAVAYAVELCLDNDAKMCKFVESEMQSHFLKCIEEKIFTPFPQKKLTKAPIILDYNMTLICRCRMPRCYKRDLLTCIVCRKLFHRKCFPMDIRYYNFKCPNCREIQTLN